MGLFTKEDKIVFSVPEMHCAHCEMNVSAILKDFPGLKSVKPNAEDAKVEVVLTGERPAKAADIAAALAAGGYPANLIS